MFSNIDEKRITIDHKIYVINRIKQAVNLMFCLNLSDSSRADSLAVLFATFVATVTDIDLGLRNMCTHSRTDSVRHLA